MALANVALTNTFDEWRTRTNQLVVQSNYYETNLPTYAYANNIGVTANAFASATIAGANTAVGDGANNFTKATIAGANTAVGNGANNFTKATLAGANTAVGDGANNFTKATIAGANTAVGDGANNFTKATMNGANTAARDATNLTSGTVPSARITGVGTISTGIWNGTAIAVGYGGTGGNDQATARSGLGLVIGTNVQAWDANLDQIAALAPTDNNFIVGNGTAWTLETPSSARTSLGLGTMATQDSSSVSISGGSISGLSSLAVSGAITATGDITAFSGSDIRLKTNIIKIDNALDKVNKISGITYDWTEEALKSRKTEEELFGRRREAGVIAQEIEEVLPEIVIDRDDGYKAVRYERLVPLLIEAIKELTAKVEMLESKVGK